VAAALSGCSLSPTSSTNSSGFTGQKALIASTLNLLASDASSGNGADICQHVFASALEGALNRSGSCATKVNNQLKTIDDFTLTVESINVSGSSATARVQTVNDRTKVIQTVTLARQKSSWRIESVGSL
jgi:copper chaperone CopZ